MFDTLPTVLPAASAEAFESLPSRARREAASLLTFRHWTNRVSKASRQRPGLGSICRRPMAILPMVGRSGEGNLPHRQQVAKFTTQGVVPGKLTGPDFGRFVEAEIKEMGRCGEERPPMCPWSKRKQPS